MSIVIKNLNYWYSDNLVVPYQALCDINLTINEGDIVAITGSTGAGKSTLTEIMAGLTMPTSGKIVVDNVDIYASKNKQEKILAKEMRQKIGMVFQYSDYQLFEETVEENIAFAPKEMGYSKEDIEKKVARSMKLVNFSENMKNLSSFSLSEGEKRKVAIAGILAFSPKYLILDEPTVGLDFKGKNEILKLILKLNREENITIVFVSHSMENISEVANKMIIMKEGKILKYDTVLKCFNDKEILKQAGLNQPKISLLLKELNINTDVVRLNEGINKIVEAIK